MQGTIISIRYYMVRNFTVGMVFFKQLCIFLLQFATSQKAPSLQPCVASFIGCKRENAARRVLVPEYGLGCYLISATCGHRECRRRRGLRPSSARSAPRGRSEGVVVTPRWRRPSRDSAHAAQGRAVRKSPPGRGSFVWKCHLPCKLQLYPRH